MKIGSVNGKLEGDRSKVRFVQTNLARVMLAAQMERADADFAVMSGGGVRDSIESGDITYKTCSRYSRSATPVHVDMKGSEIEQYGGGGQHEAGLRRLRPVRQRQPGGGRQGRQRGEDQRPAAAGG